MDDSKFLTEDILLKKNLGDQYSKLRNLIERFDHYVNSSSLDKESLKEYKKNLLKYVKDLGYGLSGGKDLSAISLDIEKVSNIDINLSTFRDKIEYLMFTKLKHFTLLVNKDYYLGSTLNIESQVLNGFTISKDIFKDIEKTEKFFLYNIKKNDLYLFNRDMILVVLSHLFFKGEKVHPIYVYKFLENLLDKK